MRTCALFLVALVTRAQGVNFYSPEREANLGARMAETVLKKNTPTAHEDARDYVERLGFRLAAKLPRSTFPYSFAVIAEDSPDPFGTEEPVMLPGGYIIVSEHLILAARNESEFAGMLAHAMAHAAARHFTRMLTRGEIAQTGTYTGEALTSPYPEFSQEFEAQADVLATRAIAATGLFPGAFADYVRRTQKEIEHPSRAAMPTRLVRLQLIEGVISKLPARSYSSGNEFLEIQQKLMRP